MLLKQELYICSYASCLLPHIVLSLWMVLGFQLASLLVFTAALAIITDNIQLRKTLCLWVVILDVNQVSLLNLLLQYKVCCCCCHIRGEITDMRVKPAMKHFQK